MLLLDVDGNSAIGDVAKTAPAIIREAAQSPLGLLSLMVLIVGVLAAIFFRGANEKIRVGIFITIFLGFVAFGIAAARTDYMSRPAKETKMDLLSAPVSQRCATIGTEFRPLPLTGFANHPLDWFINPPSGVLIYEGIPFDIHTGKRAVIQLRNVENRFLPAAMTVPIAARVCSVHVLINSVWSDRRSGQQVGTVTINTSGGTRRSVPLVPGDTIRETWTYESELFNARTPQTPPGVRWRVAAYEDQERDHPARAFIDLLSMDFDQPTDVQSLEFSTVGPNTGLVVTAITLQVGSS